MKNVSIILNAVLIVGLGILYVLHFSSKGSKADSSATTAVSVGASDLKVAVVNVDSILLNYTLSLELNEVIINKQASMKANLEKQVASFENDAKIFQDKVQKGGFLSQQRAEEAQQELMMRQQDLQKMEYEYSQQLSIEQQKMNAQLFDSVTNYIKVYNTPEKYHLVLGHSITSNILYGSQQLDITNEILNGLNKRYPAKK